MTEDRPAEPGTPGDAARTAIDATVPHSARIWNYWLGGKDNYAVDRAAGDAYVKVYPGIVDVARAGRAFLARAVRYLAIEAGIRQFLDVGTGLPTADNTHQIAQAAAPQSRIVYVDSDPLVLAHARALLTSSPEGATDYIDADMRDPEAVLARAGVSLDFDQPVALLLMGVMGHIEDDDQAQSIVRSLRAGLSPGSYLAAYDGVAEVIEAFTEAQQGYDDTGAIPYKLRGPEQIAGFFEGLEFVEPGLVRVSQWRPEAAGIGAGPDSPSLAAVARKP
jgi:S-adenosyl methyltransferase